MNPNDEIQRGRLFRAMEWSWRQLEPFRNLVHGLVQECAGSAYGRGPSRPKFEILANLPSQTKEAYCMELAANRPRVSVTSKRRDLDYFAQHFETALNNLIAEIELESTLRQWVMDAFYCMGIIKVQTANSVSVKLSDDLWADPGIPFAFNVSIDNWVHDMSATKYSRVQFAGDWYRMPFEDLKDDIFDQETIKELDLRPTSKWAFGEQDDRLDRIARSTETDADELNSMIDLCDIWIPRDGMIYTFPVNPRTPFSGGMKPIAVLPWTGPEFGPYHLLGFDDVPENIIPSSPASHLSGMARIINNMLRKQSRKAHGQKDVNWYTPAGAVDFARIHNASDQESVCVAEGTEMGVMKKGGVDQNLQAFTVAMIQLYDRMAGNLPALLGLGSQAPTEGQEEMIQSSVSKKIASMQNRVAAGTLSVIRDLGYMLWNDQAKVIPGTIKVPGLEKYRPIDATWTPGDREGEFDDYQLDIDVYSMAYQSPAKKFQTMISLVQNVFLPAAPLMEQQGVRINYKKISELAAKLLSLPQMEDIIESGNPPPETEEGSSETQGMGMPSETTRNYVRRSVSSGGTPESRSAMEQQAWLSHGNQEEQPQTVTVGG